MNAFIGFEDLGVVPFDDSGSEDLGVTPYQQSNIDANTQTKQPNQRYQIKLNPQKQNTIGGGFYTNIVGSPLDFANTLLNRSREMAQSIPHLERIPLLNTFLNRLQVPEITQPENPSTEYNIGHTLGYLPEVMGLAKPALGLARMSYGRLRNVAPKIGELLKINPSKYAKEIAYRASPEYEEIVKAPAKQMFQDIEKVAAGKPFYETKPNQDIRQEIAKQRLQDIYGKKEQINDIPLNEYENYYSVPHGQRSLIRKGYAGNDLEQMEENFLQNPSYETAMPLKKGLGKKVEHLKTRSIAPLDQTLRATLAGKKTIKSDIIKFIERELGTQYKEKYDLANKIYNEQVYPLRVAQHEIRPSINEVTNKINMKKLHTALENAGSKEAMSSNPIPKDIIKLNEEMGKRLSRRNWALGTSASTILPYGGYRLLKYFLPGANTQ